MLLVLVSACQPAVCEESYPYWRKLLEGLPVPMLISTATCVGILSGGDAVLEHQRRLPVFPAFVMSCMCAVPFLLLAVKLPPDLMFGTWGVLALVASVWGLPPLRAWTSAGWPRRIGAALLIPVLLLVMLIFTVGAGYLVVTAGQINCGPG